MDLLNRIQKELKAPKGQFNSFGKYKYRNCEDILEAVKPLLGDGTLILSDEIVQLGDRFYVKATATLCNGDSNPAKRENVSASAFAREALDKKGMDDAQITGAASSYARKYALNGLFCIDDTKDADSEEAPSAVTKAVTKMLATPARPAAPKTIEQQRLQTARRIAELCDAITLIPLERGQYEGWVFDQTGLTLEPENYIEIVNRLEALKP